MVPKVCAKMIKNIQSIEEIKDHSVVHFICGLCYGLFKDSTIYLPDSNGITKKNQNKVDILIVGISVED